MTRSPLALFLFKGLATKHTTVKWTIKNDLEARIMKIAWFSKSPIDSYSEKSSHHHFPKVGRWTLLPCGDFARLFLNMDFATIKRGLDCCLKIKWHCRILKNRKKNVNFCFKTSVPARKQEISIKTAAYSLYDSSNSALQHFEPYHWLCPGDDILCVFSLQHRWLLSVLSELQDII